METKDPLSNIVRCLNSIEEIYDNVLRYNLDISLYEKCLISRDALSDLFASYYISITRCDISEKSDKSK